MTKSILYQIYYKDQQKDSLFPFAVPYFNEDLTIFFENAVIANLVKNTNADRIGVCSWKLSQKLRIRVGERKPLTLEALNSDYDILSLTRNSARHQMLAMAYQWHKEFKPTITLLWEKLGFKMPGEAKNPIYQNSHVSKTSIYRDYVENFLSPAMELTMKDEQVNKMMTQPSGYVTLSRDADPRSVKEKLGLSDYPISPFILERCPSLYFQLKGYRISYL